jgi:hypothetical protein
MHKWSTEVFGFQKKVVGLVLVPVYVQHTGPFTKVMRWLCPKVIHHGCRGDDWYYVALTNWIPHSNDLYVRTSVGYICPDAGASRKIVIPTMSQHQVQEGQSRLSKTSH